MRKIAPHSANKGRLRPSFFFGGSAALLALCSAVSAVPAMAQEQIYRCGQEYTNAPKDASRCERLSPQSVTVIPGIKPARSAEPAVVPSSPLATPSAPSAAAASPALMADAPQRQRDQQARTIVVTELERTRQRHAELVQEYKQGAPTKTEAELSSPHKYQERVASLKAAIERHERDIDSLQRELARRPSP
jgi:predicted lipid-binding transport protein (Tim44 family)